MIAGKFVSRHFSTSFIFHKKVSTNSLTNKSLKNSSKQWLSRQLSDPYVEKAKMMSLRCRSAFKLMEVDDRFKILSPGQIVVDCGAAPGSWTQVAVKRVNSDKHSDKSPVGRVIAIDKQQIYPIDGALLFGNMDFTKSHEHLTSALNGAKANVILSDMAPSASGISHLDQENMIHLCYSVLRFAVQVSEIDSTLLVKLWQCGESKQLSNDMEKFYDSVKIVKPNASRSDSAEIFMLATNFKGLKNKQI